MNSDSSNSNESIQNDSLMEVVHNPLMKVVHNPSIELRKISNNLIDQNFSLNQKSSSNQSLSDQLRQSSIQTISFNTEDDQDEINFRNYSKRIKINQIIKLSHNKTIQNQSSFLKNVSTQTVQITKSSKLTKSTKSTQTSINLNLNLDEDKDNFLIDILKWKTSWLKNRSNDDLILCEERPQNLKLNYTTIDEYIQFYKPLLLHEIWSQIVQRFDVIKRSNPTKFEFFIISLETKDNFLILNCALPIDDLDELTYPIEGDLIVSEIYFKEDFENQFNNRLSFGYISTYSKEKISTKTILDETIIYSPECKHLLKYKIKMKLETMNLDLIDLKRKIRFSPIFNLKFQLKQCKSLTNLNESNLNQFIINPNQINEINLDRMKENDDEFNKSKLNWIDYLNTLVNNKSPGILLVEYPFEQSHDANKTLVIIKILKKIYSNWTDKKLNPKILICSSSNKSIDQIDKILLEDKEFFIEKSFDHRFHVVKLIQVNDCEDVQSIFLINKKKKESNTEESLKKFYNDKLQKEVIKHTGLIQQLNVKEFEEQYRINQNENQIKCLKDLIVEQNASLLMKANMILTTLNNCNDSSLLQRFDEKNKFTCCILDDASQYSEPDIWILLNFLSIDKLILIGDLNQLPSEPISKIAIKYGFAKSFFERFYKCVHQI